MKLFDSTMSMSIALEADAPLAVRLAAEDLQRNLRSISGKSDGFPIRESGAGIRVRVCPGNEAEAYTVQVDEDVQITGTDTLGAVYGIYAFATRCLGILPAYRLMDLFPETREEMTLPEQRFSSKPRRTRFRGWFLNDEDLLSEWKYSGGKRDLDYPFYGDVMDVSVLDMVLETALRLEINLVIPGSFIDICNEPEEKLVEAVCRRGMYVSQHHVEPVGVSYDTARNYLKARGLDEPVSFIANRSRMEEIWRHYIEKWARYGSQVIWQLGLRGKGDQAVWKADPTLPQSMEERGGIITDAIATQHQMICQALGRKDFPSTATLWNEGSELYGQGHLQLPEGTIAVFSDFGISQMFGEDFYSTPRLPGKKYGIYYHVAFWNMGPHLTEGCNPCKMAYCYRDAAKLDTLEYSILNVSNVRPVHISAMLNAWLLNDPDMPDMEHAMEQLDQAIFADDGGQVNQLRRRYYDSFADFGKAPLREAAQAWSFYYRSHEGIDFMENAATDGQLTWVGKIALRGYTTHGAPEPTAQLETALERSAEKFEALYGLLETLEAQLPRQTAAYLGAFLKYQTKHMQLITQWARGCLALTSPQTPRESLGGWYTRSADSLEQLLQHRKALEQGQWAHWHRGDKKINIPGLLEATKAAYERIVNNES